MKKYNKIALSMITALTGIVATPSLMAQALVTKPFKYYSVEDNRIGGGGKASQTEVEFFEASSLQPANIDQGEICRSVFTMQTIEPTDGARNLGMLNTDTFNRIRNLTTMRDVSNELADNPLPWLWDLLYSYELDSDVGSNNVKAFSRVNMRYGQGAGCGGNSCIVPTPTQGIRGSLDDRPECTNVCPELDPRKYKNFTILEMYTSDPALPVSGVAGLKTNEAFYYVDEIKKCVSDTSYGKGVAARILMLSETNEVGAVSDINEHKWVCLYKNYYNPMGSDKFIMIDIGRPIVNLVVKYEPPIIYLWSRSSDTLAQTSALTSIAACTSDSDGDGIVQYKDNCPDYKDPSNVCLATSQECSDTDFDSKPLCDIVTVPEKNELGSPELFNSSIVEVIVPSFTFDKNTNRTGRNCKLGKVIVGGSTVVDCATTTETDSLYEFCKSKCNIELDNCFYKAAFNIPPGRLKSLAATGDYFENPDKVINIDLEVNINSDYLAGSVGNYNTNKSQAGYVTTQGAASNSHTCTYNVGIKKELATVKNVSCKININGVESSNISNAADYLKAVSDSRSACGL